MATTTRTSSVWHHGNGGAWLTPGSGTGIGGGWFTRETFSGVGRIDNIGTLTNLQVGVDTRNTSANKGDLYVTTSAAVVPSNTTTNATKFGTWSTPNGNPFTMTVGSLDLGKFKTAIGSATTWYIIWAPDPNLSVYRELFSTSAFNTWTITHNPSTVRVWNGSSFDGYMAYVWNGSGWDEYRAHYWDGTSWILCG